MTSRRRTHKDAAAKRRALKAAPNAQKHIDAELVLKRLEQMLVRAKLQRRRRTADE